VNKALRKKIEGLLEEEAQKPVDDELLNTLRRLASVPTAYSELSPEQRNALNAFFKEVKSLMIHELLAGDYGADIIIDSIIVLCFEVGIRASKSVKLMNV
jgi:hypothetical protein